MYEADCKKSKHLKHMLAIPPFNKWTPLQALQASDLLLLKGPENIVHFTSEFINQDSAPGT